jgi:hypothetical protein
MAACNIEEKTDLPLNDNIQDLGVSNDLEEKQKERRISDYWDDFYDSEHSNELYFTIQNAEDGDTIIVPPGTYWGAVSMMDKHNLTLDFSNVSVLTKYDETLFKISDCSNIHINGLTIYHDPEWQDVSPIVLTSITVKISHFPTATLMALDSSAFASTNAHVLK